MGERIGAEILIKESLRSQQSSRGPEERRERIAKCLLFVKEMIQERTGGSEGESGEESKNALMNFVNWMMMLSDVNENSTNTFYTNLNFGILKTLSFAIVMSGCFPLKIQSHFSQVCKHLPCHCMEYPSHLWESSTHTAPLNTLSRKTLV